MMVFVIGGSGSGKSVYAEQLAVSLSEKQMLSFQTDCAAKKYYLATMKIYDKEGQHKVERHRKLRSDKGFFTIEQPTIIRKALEKMEGGNRTVLLECISNLTANEMFSEGKTVTEMQVVENITQDIRLLKQQTTNLIVVSNNIFEDGMIYDKEVMAYIRAMGKINRNLAEFAEQVVEVTAGIPLVIK